MVERERNMAGAARAGQTSGGGGGPEQATPVTDQVQQTAANVQEQVQHTAAELKGQVAARATDTMAIQKDAASDNLNTVAHAFRQAGEHLRDNDQAGIAGYVDRAAGQIEQFAGYLSKRDLRAIAQDTERFARREPTLFLGGALTLGLFAARFLKSSGQAAQGAVPAHPSGQRRAARVTPPPQLPAHTAPAASAAAVRPASLPGGASTRSAASGFGTSPGQTTPPTGAAGTADTGRTPQAASPNPGVIVGGPPREPGRGGR